MKNRTKILSQSDFCALTSLVNDEIAAAISGRRYLKQLQESLRIAEVVDDNALPRNVVALDSLVELINEDTQSVEMFRLALPSKANIALNRLSVLAPLGIAIIGCTVGQCVEVHHANLLRTFRVQDALHSNLLLELNLFHIAALNFSAIRN